MVAIALPDQIGLVLPLLGNRAQAIAQGSPLLLRIGRIRRSVQPMAAHLGLSGHNQLRHFVASPTWDDAHLLRLLVEKADALVGGPDTVLVIDDSRAPESGADLCSQPTMSRLENLPTATALWACIGLPGQLNQGLPREVWPEPPASAAYHYMMTQKHVFVSSYRNGSYAQAGVGLWWPHPWTLVAKSWLSLDSGGYTNI